MILPRPAAPFAWVEVDGRLSLICRDLDPVAVHLFTTRHWRLGGIPSGADRTPGWDEVATAIESHPQELIHVQQVHGSAVAVGRADSAVEADILVARDPDLALAVQVADCVPLLLADARTGAVAAVHAGWRGLAARVPEQAVTALTRAFGSEPADLLAAMGPAIGACCYQVGPEVRGRFVEAGFDHAVEQWFTPRPAELRDNPPMPGLRSEPRSDRWFFDGWAVARAQLLEAGLAPARIFSADLCTASHPDVFCSYRRDGLPEAGRLAAAIRIRPRRPSPDSPGDPRGHSPRA